MHLRGCLVVCLVFNVLSLKNPTDKVLSQNPTENLISPKNQSSSESLVESLTRDPLSFVELFAEADPDKVNEIIVLVEALAAVSLSTKADLVSTLASADAALTVAQANVQSKEAALETATTALQTATTGNVEAQVVRDDADLNLKKLGPGLDKEHTAIQEVLQMLRNLLPCSEADGYTSKQDTDGFSACYKYVDSQVNWAAAKDACAADGAHLVIAKSSNYAIIESMDQNNCVWLGGNDIDLEGTWVWSDGTAITETHWYIPGGEPNGQRGENCLMTWNCGGGGIEKWWNDIGCGASLKYICQK